jgi:hypothetical protein
MTFSLTATNLRIANCEITGKKCLCTDITIDGPFPVAKTIDVRKLPIVLQSAAGMALLANSTKDSATPTESAKISRAG